MQDFTGSKIALIYDSKLICIQRDEKPGLRFSGMWDLPGGGREGDETPEQTAQREVFEELGIQLSNEQIVYKKSYPAMVEQDMVGFFLGAEISQDQYRNIRFGNEGRRWALMSVSDFLAKDDIVPQHRKRLADLIKSSKLID